MVRLDPDPGSRRRTNGEKLVAVHVAAVEYDLHIGHSRSLKEKRAVVRPIVEGLQKRHHVSAAEIDHQDQWQRAGIGVAVVSGSYSQLCVLLDEVDRFVWSHPEIEVLSAERRWLDAEG